MPRIRSVKPETFTSETLTSLPVAVRWTFVGLWTYVDDGGRARADARLVKAAVWPLDDAMPAQHVAEHLDALEACSLICRYEAAGKRYLHVVNFDEHQHPNRKSESRHPECPRGTHGGRSEPAVSPQGQPTEVHSQELVAGSLEFVAGKAAAEAAQPTFGQRVESITHTYTDRVRPSNHAAIKGVVAKTIRADRWSDDEIRAALGRLADDERSVTTDSLRYELTGIPPNGHARASPRLDTDDKIRNTIALGQALAERQRKELA